MKKLHLAITLAAVLAAPTLQADMQVTLLQDTGKWSSGSGVEFRAKDAGSPSITTVVNQGAYSAQTSGYDTAGKLYFQTFCIEYNEHFNPGWTYSASVSANALYGNQGLGGDPVSIGTAWLYSQFAKGSLIGYMDTIGSNPIAYNYTDGSGRIASAGALQNVIWWPENEPLGAQDPGIGNIFRNAVLKQYGTLAAATADAYGAFGVRAKLGFSGNCAGSISYCA